MLNEAMKEADPVDETIDLEEFAAAGKRPPRAKRYRIRIDKERFVVEVPSMTGRELLVLAGKSPPEQWMIMQKVRGGEVKKIGLDERADFTTPGVERFMTLPLDQTEG
jgi:multiubiquitin